MSFPRYPKYKESGVEWLGEVPDHWDVVRLKNVLQRRITDGPHTTPIFVDEGVPFLSVDGIQDGELRFDGCRYISEADHAEYRTKALPKRDDLLMGKAASTGKIARVKVDFEFSIWSPLALIRLDHAVSSPTFFEQSLKSPIAQAQIDNYCTANTQKNISMDDIPKLVLTRPPLEEQTQIAAFLDRETAKIDELVAEQRRLMELLKEKRQAVISHSVTKGLNPNAPMKPSGIEWLGDVPTHWDVERIKFVTDSVKAGPFGSALTKDVYVSAGYRVYGQEQVIPNDFTIGDYFITPEKYEELSQYVVSPGDILISCVGTFGKIAIVPDDIAPGIINPRLIRLKCSKTIRAEYLVEVMRSIVTFEQFASFSRGGTMDVINIGTLNEIFVAVPPMTEQEDLLNFIRGEIAKFDTLTSEAQHGIDLLQERRTALISAAVTGQIDVRSH